MTPIKLRIEFEKIKQIGLIIQPKTTDKRWVLLRDIAFFIDDFGKNIYNVFYIIKHLCILVLHQFY